MSLLQCHQLIMWLSWLRWINKTHDFPNFSTIFVCRIIVSFFFLLVPDLLTTCLVPMKRCLLKASCICQMKLKIVRWSFSFCVNFNFLLTLILKSLTSYVLLCVSTYLCVSWGCYKYHIITVVSNYYSIYHVAYKHFSKKL